MGDVAAQTSVERIDDGRYRAMVHDDWEIWGPCGGYVAAIALRAAGAESSLGRPASFFCHYLSVAAFAPVDLVVTPLRAGRTVAAHRVAMSQEGRPVLDAMVWSVGEVEGLEHRHGDAPAVTGPADTPVRVQRRPEDGEEERRPFAFWENFEQRAITWSESWPPRQALPPEWLTWVRYKESHGPADPWVNAARHLLVLDVGSWPAGSRPHAYADPPFIAPSLDLYAAFGDPGCDSEWLLLDHHAPLAAGGLLSWTGRVWSEERTLLAQGGGQAVFRHT